MSYMKIRCDNCGESWEVYEWGIKNEFARYCPHCLSAIDEQTWKNQILPAFGSVGDANRELIKDYEGYNTPLFAVDMLSDTYTKRREDEDAEG